MIVSDATAIITLINIDEFDLLKLFTKKIILTNIVF
jgi:predicted nucleic acid-binding protein